MKVKCPYCNGGFYQDIFTSSNGDEIVIKQYCLFCNGTGYIEKEIDDEKIRAE